MADAEQWSRRLQFYPGGLDAFGQLAWLTFTGHVAIAAGGTWVVEVSLADISSKVFTPVRREKLAGRWPIRWLEQDENLLNSRQPFAFVSGAQALSMNVLAAVDCVRVEPQVMPLSLVPDVYWRIAGEGGWLSSLEAVVAEVFPEINQGQIDTLKAALVWRQARVTAITSVYDGDAYLPGFLRDCADWTVYPDCEHLLIRAGSPGEELPVLAAHVRQHPNAVLINLGRDPGLYGVWNMGLRLSSAPYLTSANLDDRRSPQQLEVLLGWLEQHPGISAVSTPLLVSTRANLPWSGSEGCRVMFASQPAGIYGVSNLFSRAGGETKARNLPHCMPVWRRELHYQAGLFQEDRYGPSSDWEFWLRAGVLGARYGFLAKPLGLYLRHQDSYWHRQDEIDFDRRIIDDYADLAASGTRLARESFPFDQRVVEVERALQSGHMLAMLCGLSDCALLAMSGRASPAAIQQTEELAVRCLGIERFTTYIEAWRAMFIDMSNPVENALTLAIELARSLKQFAEPSRLVKVLEGAFLDLYMLRPEPAALIGLAYLARTMSKPLREAFLLRSAAARAAINFWPDFQRVYRFDLDLVEAAQHHCDLRGAHHGASLEERPGQSDSRLAIWYFPAYRSNQYTRLLYGKSSNAGAVVKGVGTTRAMRRIEPDPERDNVLHIHWTGQVFRRMPGWLYGVVGRRFLSDLKGLKAKGIELRWTVHNRLSHECRNPAAEIAFRRALYDLVDKVYLHHPMHLVLLDWLPDRSKCILLEHGSYPVCSQPSLSRAEARERLGLAPDDFILLYMGLLKPYKDLATYLPIVRTVGEMYPQLKLVIAGRVHSRSLGAKLRRFKGPNIHVQGGFISDEMMAVYTRAADMGFLTYRDILTSGALFHLMSAGLPVIAPEKGTIPAYLVNGWNGFTYRDTEDLGRVLVHAASLPAAQVSEMGMNASAVASRLEWRFS